MRGKCGAHFSPWWNGILGLNYGSATVRRLMSHLPSREGLPLPTLPPILYAKRRGPCVLRPGQRPPRRRHTKGMPPGWMMGIRRSDLLHDADAQQPQPLLQGLGRHFAEQQLPVPVRGRQNVGPGPRSSAAVKKHQNKEISFPFGTQSHSIQISIFGAFVIKIYSQIVFDEKGKQQVQQIQCLTTAVTNTLRSHNMCPLQLWWLKTMTHFRASILIIKGTPTPP